MLVLVACPSIITCSCEWKANIRECEAPRGTRVGQIGLRTRDLNSRVTGEHSRARVQDRHQLVDYHRLLGASWSAGSPQDWNTSSAYQRPASKLKRSKMSKTKMSQHFFPGEKRKKGFFFASPPAFHRLLFMSPFAGDIRAEPGSLKWIAQIPRKACR